MTTLGDRRIWSVAAGAATLLWLIVVGWYVFDYLGSDSLAGMLPHQLGMVIAGIVTPLLLLWLIVGVIVLSAAGMLTSLGPLAGN